MKDQERAGLRRSAAVQIAAALAGAYTALEIGDDRRLAGYAVATAEAVIAALEEREAQEVKDREQADATEKARKADVAAGAQQVEPR